jgi:autotransporter-associated beta strand protein
MPKTRFIYQTLRTHPIPSNRKKRLAFFPPFLKPPRSSVCAFTPMKTSLVLAASLALCTASVHADSTAGGAALVKTGTGTGVYGGTLSLGGSNTYTGTTTVSAGTLEVGSAGSLSTAFPTSDGLIFNRADTLTVASPTALVDSPSGFVVHAAGFNGPAGSTHARIIPPYLGGPIYSGDFTGASLSANSNSAALLGAGTLTVNSALNLGTSQTLGALQMSTGPTLNLSDLKLSTSGPTADFIPEPTSAALLTLAALGLLAQRRRSA